VSTLPKEHLSALQRAVGMNPDGSVPIHRNHYSCSPDNETVLQLVKMGLMEDYCADPNMSGRRVFTVTQKGIQLVKQLTQVPQG